MNNKKQLLTLVALVAVVAILAGIYCLSQPEIFAGEKAFTLTVVHKDGTRKVFELTTTEEMLGPALVEHGIIVPSDSPGLYNTVDGETADYSVDRGYWSFQENWQEATRGMDTTPVTEGGDYQLVYTVYEGP